MNHAHPLRSRPTHHDRRTGRRRAHRLACGLLLAAILQPSLASKAFAYTHPGGLYTEIHYTDIFLTLLVGAEPWFKAYMELADQAEAKRGWQPQPVAALITYGENDGTPQLSQDAYAAYQCALLHQIQHDPQCLDTTIEILDAWARVNTSMTDPHQSALGAVVLGTGLMLAAEIAWGSGTWPRADFDRFRTWADRIYKPASDRAINSHENNWRSWGILGRLLYAHLFDNTSLFATGARDLRNHINASIEWDGRQPHETGRAENGIWYSYFSLEPLTAAAAVVRNTTGADIFTESSNEAIKLKKALQYLFHYIQHPDRWPHHLPAGSLTLAPVWSYTKYPVNLFETMGGTYGVRDFANYAAPHRTVFGGLERDSADVHHFGWNFPTFNLPVDYSDLLASDAFDQDGSEDWTMHGGTWGVERMVNRWREQYVFRQSNMAASDSSATFGAPAWANYEVSALVQANTLSTSARFGLVASHRDEQNWVRFVVDMEERRAEINVANNGLTTTVASVPLPKPIVTGQWYELRAVTEAGNLHFLIDDELAASAGGTTHPGAVGLYVHKGDVSFDTLVVKGPRMRTHFFNNTTGQFGAVRGSWSLTSEGGSGVYRQRSLTTSMAASAAGDVEWLDYRAETMVKANAFNAGGLAGVGLYARYRNHDNYYNFHFYKTSSGAGELRIEKRFAGAVSVLKAMPFTMQTGRWYRMAADVSGPRLRFYVDGALMLEASDTQLYNGKIALDAHRTDASFSAVLVY